MQTDIKVAQAFGLIGEMYDLTPRRVDAFETATDINMGDVVGRKSDGTLGKASSTYSGFAGFCVRPKEAINYGATSALDPSLKVPAGVTAQVASMGRIILPLYLEATVDNKADEATALADAETALKALSDVVDGATAYYKGYVLSTDSSNSTAIGKFVKGADVSESVVITSNVASADTSHEGKKMATAKGYVVVVVEIG